MALEFIVKRKMFSNITISLKQLLSEHLRYGVHEDVYEINLNKEGETTTIFDWRKIGRGVDVELMPSQAKLNLFVPCTERDVELAFELLEKILNLYNTKKFQYEGQNYTMDQLSQLKDEVKQFQKSVLTQDHNHLIEGKRGAIVIYGAMHPVTFSKEKFCIPSGDHWDEFADLLDEVQMLDPDEYFAKPNFYQKKNEDEIIGIYTLTTDTDSSFPIHPNCYQYAYKISKWYVRFYDYDTEAFLGCIPYDTFVEHCDTSDLIDAERFCVSKNREEMAELLEKYEVEV